MEIREILPEDTYEIRHKVMWANKDIAFVKVPDDHSGKHFGVFENGVLVSIVSVFFKNEEMQFRKFATLVAYQGRGYGSMLLKHVFQLAENQGAKKIWCNARTSKTGFYAKFGMEETDVQFMKEGVEYVVVERNF